jgi:hypothetical protein
MKNYWKNKWDEKWKGSTEAAEQPVLSILQGQKEGSGAERESERPIASITISWSPYPSMSGGRLPCISNAPQFHLSFLDWLPWTFAFNGSFRARVEIICINMGFVLRR